MSADIHLPAQSTQSRPAHNRTADPAGNRTRIPWTLILVLLATFGVILAWVSQSLLPQPIKRLTHTVRPGNLVVSVTEQGTLESSNNTEIVCKVRGFNTVTWVIPDGSTVTTGDELVRLDTKIVEEAFSLTKTNTHVATATLERSRADFAKAEIAIDAYLKGRYRNQKKALENRLKIATRNLENAKLTAENSQQLFEKGFVTALEIEGNQFTVEQAQLELEVVQTEIDVLERFTKEMELETLRGNLTASRSKMLADEAGLRMEKARRKRAEEEVAACTIRAGRSGLVIYPSAAAWKQTPDIAQGATVRKDQVLLLMPDLSQMQIKVGIHESIIRRMKPGLKAIVTLPDRTLEGTVSKVANVTRPAGWWTGNVVKYDTIIQLPSEPNLKPGMSAEVEIIMAEHQNELTLPVAAVVDGPNDSYCWLDTPDGPRRRSLQLGDTDDIFVIVKSGLKENDRVLLNPAAFDEESDRDRSHTQRQLQQQLEYSNSSDNNSSDNTQPATQGASDD